MSAAPSPSSIDRLAHLDGLRGVAASIVVLAHYAAAFLPHALFGGDAVTHFSWEPLFLHTPLGLLLAGNFAVCLFFLMSGYVLCYSLLVKGAGWMSVVAAMVKRPVRLGGVVLASSLISLILWKAGLFANEEAAMHSQSQWFNDLWSGAPPAWEVFTWQSVHSLFESARQYNPAMWTMQRELIGSWLVYGVLLLARPRPIRWLVSALLAMWFARNFTQCFIFGLMIADLRHWLDERKINVSFPTWLSISMAVVGVICAAFPKYAVNSEISHTIFSFLPTFPWLGGSWSMVGALLIFVLILQEPIAQRVFTLRPILLLGRISYSLYAAHFLVLGTAGAAAFAAIAPRSSYSIAAAAALTVLIAGTLAAAVVIHYAVDHFAIMAAQRVGRGTLNLLSRLRPLPFLRRVEPRLNAGD